MKKPNMISVRGETHRALTRNMQRNSNGHIYPNQIRDLVDKIINDALDREVEKA